MNYMHKIIDKNEKKEFKGTQIHQLTSCIGQVKTKIKCTDDKVGHDSNQLLFCLAWWCMVK